MKTIKTILIVLLITGINYSNAHVGGHLHIEKKYKTWTFKDGTQVEGIYSLAKNGKVYLEEKDRQVRTYTILDLSPEDLEYVKQKIIAIEKINAPIKGSNDHYNVNQSAIEKSKESKTDQTNNEKRSVMIYWIIGIALLALALMFIFKKVFGKYFSNTDAAMMIGAAILAMIAFSSCNRKGCTDPTATNYSEKAKNDDGSCAYDNTDTFTYSETPLPNDVTDMTAAFAPYSPHVSTFDDGTTFYVEADAIPNHEMMKGITAWIDQFPVYQKMSGNNSWQIPIAPEYSTTGYNIREHFRKYAIAVAANGIAIFNPYNATGLISADIGELDEYGGHAGTGDDYHYHAAPTHLDAESSATIVAYALDGFPVYGALEPDGSEMQALDTLYNGHEIDGSFHYHALDVYPYLINTFRGTVGVDKIEDAPYDQITPQPSTQNFRGNPYPLSGGATSTLIDSCIANGNGNGYTLYYTVDNKSKKVEYYWAAGTVDTITFNFYNESGTIEHAEEWTR